MSIPYTRRRVRTIFLLVCVGALGYALMHALKKEESSSLPQANLLHVTIVHPQTKMLQQSLRLSGVIVPREDVVVTTELAQVRVTDVSADEGMRVEAGQQLATLDPASLNHQFRELQATSSQAERDYKRAYALRNSGAITKESLDQKLASYKALKAQFDDAALKLGRARVSAPTAGIIYERLATIGELVSSTQPLFRIAKDGEYELEVEITEADLAKVRVGQSARVTMQSVATPLEGTVRVVTPHIDPQSRMAKLRISVPQATQVAVGAFGEAELVIASKQVLAVPSSALMQDSGSFVWAVKEDGVVQRVPVNTGIQAGGWVEVRGQLDEKTALVARAGVFLNEGDKVVPIRSGAKP